LWDDIDDNFNAMECAAASINSLASARVPPWIYIARSETSYPPILLAMCKSGLSQIASIPRSTRIRKSGDNAPTLPITHIAVPKKSADKL
jgi:hypothetical protein